MTFVFKTILNYVFVKIEETIKVNLEGVLRWD